MQEKRPNPPLTGGRSAELAVHTRNSAVLVTERLNPVVLPNNGYKIGIAVVSKRAPTPGLQAHTVCAGTTNLWSGKGLSNGQRKAEGETERIVPRTERVVRCLG